METGARGWCLLYCCTAQFWIPPALDRKAPAALSGGGGESRVNGPPREGSAFWYRERGEGSRASLGWGRQGGVRGDLLFES